MIESIKQAYDFIARGNPVMILILLGSILCIALIIERFVSLRRKKVVPTKLLLDVDDLLREKKAGEALALCRVTDVPMARILAAGLGLDGKSKADRVEAMEMIARREMNRMERNLDILGTLAAVGPLLGLFGTVTGMIQTFGVIRVYGVGDPMMLAGGIAEALLSTAGGLIIGIPALIFQRYFLARVDRFALQMEEFAQRVLKLAGVTE